MSDQSQAASPVRVNRAQFDLVCADDFTGDALDGDRWVAHYLPHWTTAERSAARYTFGGDGLRLLMEGDQPALHGHPRALRTL